MPNLDRALRAGRTLSLRKIDLTATFLLFALAFIADARPLRIEIDHRFDGKPLRFNDANLKTATGDRISIVRLDYLLSELSLQRTDGSWLDSENWFAYFSAGDGLTEVTLPRGPSGTFQAVRFRVGVNPDVNASDPHLCAPSDPLHPQVNGLHWGWKGGYVFLAIEGRYDRQEDHLGGFSYHIANNENSMTIELPVDLDTSKHSRISLEFDVARIFSGLHHIDIERMGDSTHSRESDPLAAMFKENIENAFSVSGVDSQLIHRFEPTVVVQPKLPDNTTAYPFRISERLPRPNIPEDNHPTVEGVALGKALFHDARLSKNNAQSCAGCHLPQHAFSDRGNRFSAGVDGDLGDRNAMPLFNLIWNGHFFWDGRVGTLREQVVIPIEDPREMNETLENVLTKLRADKGYESRFTQTFGSPGITSERLGLALEQYLFTEISQEAKYDRAVRGETAFTEEEKRGLQLFVTEHDPKRGLRGADCFHCHGGNLFTSQRFANNGLDIAYHDKGRSIVTDSDSDLGLFKVPSLRNVEVTAPYMHDGRFATLEEVVEHYNSGVKRSATLDPNLAKHPVEGLGLNEADKRALVAFLKTLTDVSFLNRDGTQVTATNLTSKIDF